jgi:hypothetical protein
MMTAMATDVLVPASARTGLAWQRRLRRKLVVLDVIAGLAGALGTVVVRYDGERTFLGDVDYRLLALGTGLLWVTVVAASGGYDRRIVGLGTEEFRRIGNAAVRVLALLVLVGFAVKADTSRGVVVGSVASMGLLSVLLRWVSRRVLHRERRRHQQVNVVPFQRPGQPAQGVAPLDGDAGDRNSVGAHHVDRVGDIRTVAEHRHRHLACIGDTRGDHGETGVLCAAE